MHARRPLSDDVRATGAKERESSVLAEGFLAGDMSSGDRLFANVVAVDRFVLGWGAGH